MKNILFTAPLCIALSFSIPAFAGTKDNSERDHTSGEGGSTPITSPTTNGFSRDPVERFVESNVLETLYHELGHALIDTLHLPIFGPEEHAADFLAAILIHRVHDETTSRQMVLDVAASYEADYQGDRATYQRAYYADEHANPMQRYYNLACLYLGGDPEGRRGVANQLKLPDGRAEFCGGEFEMANYAWGDVLDQLGEDAPAQTLTLDWILDNGSHLTQFVTREVAILNRMLALPEPITVSVIPCGEVNAFYDPDPKEIIICTELSEHLAEIAPHR